MRFKSILIFFYLVLMCSLLTYGPSVSIAQTSEDTATEVQSLVKKPEVPELQDIVPLAAIRWEGWPSTPSTWNCAGG